VLDLYFDGWFQCRLATDPDPADEPRGVSGWTFAVGEEPDLDRVIRFQNPAVRRSHGPTVGVQVRRVEVDGTPVGGHPGHPMVGATVELGGQPKFEGRNGLVAEDGQELIDPFELRVVGGDVVVERTDQLDPLGRRIPEVSLGFLRRRMANGVENNQAAIAQVLAAIRIPDPRAHAQARVASLRADLAATTDPDARAALGKRLRSVRPVMPIRVSYAFDLGEFGGVGTIRDDGGDLGRLDPVAPWPLALWLGGWHADALCGFASGQLTIPSLAGS
jgi:hypothetical protein